MDKCTCIDWKSTLRRNLGWQNNANRKIDESKNLKFVGVTIPCCICGCRLLSRKHNNIVLLNLLFPKAQKKTPENKATKLETGCGCLGLVTLILDFSSSLS